MSLSETKEVAAAFDYSSVAVDDAAKLRKLVERVRNGHRKHFSAVLQVGRDLLEAKGILAHGSFTPWLEAEFRWNERTAQRYMSVAAEFSTVKTDLMSVLDPTTVYALAAKSTPPEIREQVVARIEAGERVEPAEIKEIVKDARDAARKDRERQRIANLKPAKRSAIKRQESRAQKQEEEWRAKREKAKAATIEAASFLRERLGESLADFATLIAEADLHEFRRLLLAE